MDISRRIHSFELKFLGYSSDHETFLCNACNIKTLLKEQPEKYVLVENHKVNHVKPSPCRNRFALPAVNDENDRSIIIKNFAS
jgi:hypothetical protein